MKNFYLALTILGAIIPYVFFAQHIQANGVDLILFIKDLFANGAAAGFSADLLFTSFIFWLHLYKNTEVRYKPLIIVINLTIGLSCAFPFYLYLNEKKADQ